MNREDIICMAREASPKNHDRNIFFDMMVEDLERFAALVASAEREACAKLCEQDDSMRWAGAANAIRARGQA